MKYVYFDNIFDGPKAFIGHLMPMLTSDVEQTYAALNQNGLMTELIENSVIGFSHRMPILSNIFGLHIALLFLGVKNTFWVEEKVQPLLIDLKDELSKFLLSPFNDGFEVFDLQSLQAVWDKVDHYYYKFLEHGTTEDLRDKGSILNSILADYGKEKVSIWAYLNESSQVSEQIKNIVFRYLTAFVNWQ